MAVRESIRSSAGMRNNDNIKYQVFPHVIDKFLSQIFFYETKKLELPANDQIAFSRRFTLSYGLEHLSQ